MNAASNTARRDEQLRRWRFVATMSEIGYADRTFNIYTYGMYFTITIYLRFVYFT